MIYRSQKEFEHIIQQLNNVQNIIQQKILVENRPKFRPTSEHPLIDFFRRLGYNVTPATNKLPDEIGYNQYHQPIGFELIRAPRQIIPHKALKQAIQRSQYFGKIKHSVIITDGIFSQSDRHWAKTAFSDVKLTDTSKLNSTGQAIYKSYPHHNKNRSSYTDQKQILQKIKLRIIHERRKQKINQQRVAQLRIAIHKIKGFTPLLKQFKNDFKKSAKQQDHWIHQLQKELNRQRQTQKKLQARRKLKNSQIRLRAAKGFSNEVMKLM